jgi:Fe-S cluster biosynthesis and repair protein YggX
MTVPGTPGTPGATVALCCRCQRTDAPAMKRAPLPGAAGRQIVANVCADCWAEWATAEVMLINELRLNFMDPAAQERLNAEMRTFLHLPAAG